MANPKTPKNPFGAGRVKKAEEKKSKTLSIVFEPDVYEALKLMKGRSSFVNTAVKKALLEKENEHRE